MTFVVAVRLRIMVGPQRPAEARKTHLLRQSVCLLYQGQCTCRLRLNNSHQMAVRGGQHRNSIPGPRNMYMVLNRCVGRGTQTGSTRSI